MEPLLFECPTLGAVVELSEEREQHITIRHPELLPIQRALIAATLEEPDAIRASARMPTARLFSKYHPELRGGKLVVVVVVSEVNPERHWIVTAYLTSNLFEGNGNARRFDF